MRSRSHGSWSRWAAMLTAAEIACSPARDDSAAPAARKRPPGAEPGLALAPVTIEEATNVAATVSPDHQTIVLEVHGALFSLPAAGGDARRLTPDWLEPSRPHFSPRGDLIAFQAYAGGTFHVWVMHPDGGGLRRITSGHGDDREPRVSPDGERIAFASDRAFEGSYDIWVTEIASGALTRWTSSDADEFEPSWSQRGDGATEIAFVSGTGSTGTAIEAADAGGHRRTLARTSRGSRIEAPSVSPDGKKVAYVRLAGVAIPGAARLMVGDSQVGPLDDVFPFAPAWLSDDELLYTANGHIRVTRIADGTTRDIPFRASFDVPASRTYARKRHGFDDPSVRPVRGIVSPALAPDGKRVVFEALDQLWVMEIGEAPRPITHDGYFKVDPAWSPDGKRIAYGCDRSGTLDLWIMDVSTGTERRLTTLGGAEIAPAWSPDGRTIAFQDQTGATSSVDVTSGKIAPLAPAVFAPGRPSWSADGRAVAFAALKPFTRRFREGTNRISIVDVATKTSTSTEPAELQSIATRGDDGPVYSPDGSAMAFVMNGVLWVRPVDDHGRPTGDATRIGNEAADAPTWSGDGSHLLFLSNGRLRLVSRDGSNAVDVPLDLSWRPEVPEDLVLIHAGKLWDGRGAATASDVDVLVAHARIAGITPHRPDARAHAQAIAARYVDASDKTVVPGLWESHTHHLIAEKSYGDRLGRLWLAYGVTSLFSMADPAYRAVEAREAYASGARVGPRLFATGEALDGERTYYSVMRPVPDPSQLPVELSRAEALGYDMIKTYVRFPAAMQAEVTRAAHERMGVWTGSHYMLPGLAAGVDAMTHISATTRTGYAYTRSATGITYGDVPALLIGGGMFVMTTPFESSALYAEDPKMVDDARLLTLNTPWNQKALREKRDRMVESDRTASLRFLEREMNTVARILDAGGTVLAATDSPLNDVATALHLNLRAQVKFGRAPWQALQTATSLPAKAFGLDADLGTLEPGKLADLVIVDGDPTSHIEDLVKVHAVMSNGRLYTLHDLEAPFATTASGAE